MLTTSGGGEAAKGNAQWGKRNSGNWNKSFVKTPRELSNCNPHALISYIICCQVFKLRSALWAKSEGPRSDNKLGVSNEKLEIVFQIAMSRYPRQPCPACESNNNTRESKVFQKRHNKIPYNS